MGIMALLIHAAPDATERSGEFFRNSGVCELPRIDKICNLVNRATIELGSGRSSNGRQFLSQASKKLSSLFNYSHLSVIAIKLGQLQLEAGFLSDGVDTLDRTVSRMNYIKENVSIGNEFGFFHRIQEFSELYGLFDENQKGSKLLANSESLFSAELKPWARSALLSMFGKTYFKLDDKENAFRVFEIALGIAQDLPLVAGNEDYPRLAAFTIIAQNYEEAGMAEETNRILQRIDGLRGSYEAVYPGGIDSVLMMIQNWVEERRVNSK